MLANGCYECLRPWSRARYAAHLGVSAEALELLRVGHSTCEMLERDTLHRWSYPMASPGAECCGIQLRSWDHGKKAIGGSKLGLFRPLNFEPARPFLICEGASDTAAAITLRFNAIGRASAKSTAAAVQEIVRTSRTPAVCIVADADEVGLGGAHQLGDMLLRYCEVRIVRPPSPCKDLRAWLLAHATADDVRQVIRNSPPINEELSLWQKPSQMAQA